MPEKASPSKQPNPTIGYPHMEQLIEKGDFSQFNRSFKLGYETLERMLKTKSGGLGKQKQVRQALKAYELTSDLIKYLLEVKKKMQEQAGKSQAIENK